MEALERLRKVLAHQIGPSITLLTRLGDSPDGGVGAALSSLLKQPDGVELLEDVSPAGWLEASLWPWDNHSVKSGVQLGLILPEGFAAYARVFHPADLDGEHGLVRWSTVASWTGRTVHPLMQFGRIANLPDPYTHPSWGSLPICGELSDKELRAVAEALREFTSTADHCYFCVWDGYGFIDRDRYKEVPRVRLPGRDYLLFRGPLASIMSFADPSSAWQSPNIWWPADRVWCVATEIDLFDTYIGRSTDCIERILSCPELEALPATIEARIDFGADTINI